MYSSLSKEIWRRLKYRYRRALKPNTITINGARVNIANFTGPRWVVNSLLKETYERKEIELIKRYLKPHDRVLELGSGLGVTSLIIAGIVGDDRLFCYDANPYAVQLARENFSLNRVDISIQNKAAVAGPDAPGSLEFYPNPNILGSSCIKRNGATTHLSVPTFNIEDILIEQQISAIVMDIEGAECGLISRIETWGFVSLLIVELHPHLTGDEDIARMESHLRKCGFQCEPGVDPKVGVFIRQRSA